VAQFYAYAKGNRQEVHRLGSKKSGARAGVNGWHSGIEVIGCHNDVLGDYFKVYLTGGSTRAKSDVYLGYYKGDEFIPDKTG
jgi:hypothetical protein